jgi:hypothetical protein
VKTRSWLWIGVVLLVVFCAPAYAQQTKTAGVVLGLPGSIGFVWSASDRVALRPEFQFATSSTDSTSGVSATTSTVDATTFGIGGGVLFYTAKWDDLRTYLCPRFMYTRSTSSTTVGDTTTTGYQASGSFGAEYSLGERFSVFGEIGLGYSHTSIPSSGMALSTFKVTGHSTSTRSSMGVTIHF